MASRVCLIIGGLLLLIFTCQSAPIDSVDPKALVASPTSDQKPIVHEELLKPAETDKSASVSPSDSTTTERNEQKQKRQIALNAYPTWNDEEDENEDEHILYTDVKESPANDENGLDRLDDKNLFSDLQMNPAELSTILHQHRRRRRDVQLMDPSNQRRKRSLSSYDLYSSESFDDPYANFVDEERYLRPLRSFAPIYWFPPVLDRSVRSFDRDIWPVEYVNPLVNDADTDEDDDDDDDDVEEIPMTIYEEDDDDENDYPLLMKSYANPFDNLQLQTTYNTVDFPFDDNDDDALTIIDENPDDNDIDDDEEVPFIYEPVRPSFMRYDPLENFLDV